MNEGSWKDTSLLMNPIDSEFSNFISFGVAFVADVFLNLKLNFFWLEILL